MSPFPPEPLPAPPASAISRRRLAASGAALLVLAACGPSETREPPGEVRFGFPVSSRASRRQGDWRALIADLGATTGLTVRPVFAPSEEALVEAMKRRLLDAGWFSNAAALAAVRSAGAEVFASAVASPYRSVLVTRAKDGVTLAKLLKCDRTLRYGRTGRASLAGDLAPIAFLFGPNKLDPAKCFKSIATRDGEANLAAVAAGALDVAAVDSSLLDRASGAPASLQAIWASDPLPPDPLLWRKDLDPELKETLRQFFITDARGDTPTARKQRDDLTPLGVDGFEPADDSLLLPAREIEARVKWAEAQWSGDAARIEASQRALDAVLAERQSVQLAPAGTQ